MDRVNDMEAESPAARANLFDEVRLRDVVLRNRLVVSPMCQYSAVDGVAADYHLAHIGRFAMGGFGLVMVESTAVTPDGRITFADLGLWDERQVEPLSKIVGLAHDNGAAIGLQLGHAGHKAATLPPWYDEEDRPIGSDWEVVSCSPRPFRPGWRVPRPLTPVDLDDICTSYVSATRRAAAARFDVLEIHLAHGYLLHSFWSPISNHRDDGFGGTREGRARFPLQVVAAVRHGWPADKPLFVRLSVVDNDDSGLRMPDTVWMARQLAELGVDVVDCSSGGLGEGYSHPMDYGYQAAWSQQVRDQVGVATMAVGLITDPRQAQRIVSDGQADLVALGREALTSPSWPIMAREAIGAFSPDTRFDLLPIQSRGWLSQRQRILDRIEAGVQQQGSRTT